MKNLFTPLICTICALFLSTGSNGQAATTYYLTIADSTKIASVATNGSAVTVTFTQPSLTAIAANYSITTFRRAYPISRFPHLRNIWLVGTTANVQTLVSQLHSAAPTVFPVYSLKGTLTTLGYTPSDWYNYEDGYLDYINARKAWDIQKGNPNVVIGVSEPLPVNENNPDLANKIVQNNNAGSSGNSAHSTRVAGLVAGETDDINHTGFPSIGFKCKLHMNNWDYISLYELAKTYNRRILNASWGEFINDPRKNDGCNELYEEGCFLVASAGNGGLAQTPDDPNNLEYPASYDNVFSVSGIAWKETSGTTNRQGRHELYVGDTFHTLQHNPAVDLLAPGYSIGGLTNNPPYFVNGDPVYASGTSFSAPLVSGTAGLMLSQSPCLSPYQIEYFLKKGADTTVLDSADNVKYKGRLGRGLLNAFKTLDMLKNPQIYNLPNPDPCNRKDLSTFYIKGIEINTLCDPFTPGKTAPSPKLTPILENGGGDPANYVYRWEELDSPVYAFGLDHYDIAEPTIYHKTGYIGDTAYFRLTVWDASEVKKVAKRYFRIPFTTELRPELAMRDSYMDMMDEPGSQAAWQQRDWQVWTSPDIWVRNAADNGLVHQNPEYYQHNDNEVYVKVRNIGCTDYNNSGQDGVEIYWTKASTGEVWKGSWDGSTTVAAYPSGQVPAGGLINTLIIPSLPAGQSAVLGTPWHVPYPEQFKTADGGSQNTIDACLLARIQEYLYNFPVYYPLPMKIPELQYTVITPNVRNNNNIVTRNLIITNFNLFDKFSPRHQVYIGNAEQNSAVYDLQFINEQAINKHFAGNFSSLASVVLHLGDLYDRWQLSGGGGTGFVEANATQKTVTWNGTGDMTLLGIRLNGSEQIPVSVEFRLLDTNSVPVAATQTLHLRQFPAGGNRDITPYGNVSFEVHFNGGTDKVRKATRVGNTLTSGKDYAVYPNPASNIIYIERLSTNDARLQIRLVDAVGKCVGSTGMDNSARLGSIRTAGLSSGTYFVEINSEGKKSVSYKIIVK